MSIETSTATRRFRPIPEMTHVHGPVTRVRVRRMFAGLLLLWLIGAVPLVIDASDRYKAFGLGLFAPGAGFLYSGSVLWFAVSLLAFIVAIFVWFTTGPIVVPPTVWLGSAALAAASTDGAVWAAAEWCVPLLVSAFIGAGALARWASFRAAVRRGRAINEQLARVTVVVPSRPAVPPVEEATLEELAMLRYPLDLALQPLDRFDGFVELDQFREAATRYQLNAIGYALSMAQYTRTPAFSGYLAEAQRNAIDKMRDRRVWNYWALENRWGNLSWDPNPIPRDNVMFTGYWGTMIGMYELLNGSHYGRPGSLSLRRDENTVYDCDFPTLAHAVRRNFRAEPLGQFPCEPFWIYPYCNTYGVNTLLMYDTVYGTSLAEEVIEGVQRSYDTGEFMRPDGRIMFIKNKLGPTLFPASTAGEAGTTFWLHAGLPELAERTWWMARETVLDTRGAAARLRLQPWDRIDPGNYNFGRGVFAWAGALLAAREMGDTETAKILRHAIDERETLIERDGVLRYADMSPWANQVHVMAAFTRHNAFHDLAREGIPEEWKTGPRLAAAAYPDVLVARAVTDGTALDLVLRPGAGSRRTTLEVDRLRPGTTYLVEGGRDDTVQAGPDGTARLQVDLNDRTVLRIRPQ